MHPRTAEVIAHLDEHRAALEAAFAEVPVALREQRPAPDRWSVAEVLDHLVVIEARIVKLLTQQIETARAAGLGQENDTSPVVPTINMRRMLDRSRPITASESSQPRTGCSAQASWTLLAEHRQRLLDLVRSADGLALGEIVIPHPALGPINVWQWFVFVGGHEARHTAQIREVAGALGASTRAGE
jgi:DinB superfamily